MIGEPDGPPLAAQAREAYASIPEPAAAERAVRLWDAVVAADPAPHHLGELAGALLDRYQACDGADHLGDPAERDGDTADLDHALALLQRALGEAPQGDPARAVLLNNLGLCLRVRFEHDGRTADLDSATTAFWQAVELTVPGSPERVTYLENLANCLVDRYRVDDDLACLEQAVATLRNALDGLPDGSPRRRRVRANLAGALWHRWTENRDDRDLEAVIGILREVVDLHVVDLHVDDTVGPAAAQWSNNLAMALESRYHHRGEATDLAEAIARYQAACEFAAYSEQAGDARWSMWVPDWRGPAGGGRM